MGEHEISIRLEGCDRFEVHQDGSISAQRGLVSSHLIADNFIHGWLSFPVAIVQAAFWYWWGYKKDKS